ncbi:hypothetical protein J6590_100222 [Homalodisca vitripennis]|nr:hypothetical protein J6590_100222 [Homalodisca vitripennis]
MARGSWREDTADMTSMLPLQKVPRKPGTAAKEYREEFAEYFMNNGKIPWQNDYSSDDKIGNREQFLSPNHKAECVDEAKFAFSQIFVHFDVCKRPTLNGKQRALMFAACRIDKQTSTLLAIRRVAARCLTNDACLAPPLQMVKQSARAGAFAPA